VRESVDILVGHETPDRAAGSLPEPPSLWRVDGAMMRFPAKSARSAEDGMPLPWRLAMVALALALVLLPALAASAASTPTPALPNLSGSGDKTLKPPGNPAEIGDFVGKLDDRQARQVLLETLKERAPLAERADAEGLGEVFGEASRQLQDAGSRFASLFQAARQFEEAPRLLKQHLAIDAEGALGFAIRFVGVAFLGLLAEYAVSYLLGRMAARRSRQPNVRVVALGIRVGAFLAYSAIALIAGLALAETLPTEQQRLFLRLGVAFWAVRGADLLALAGIASFLGDESFAGRGPPRYPVAFSGSHAIIAFGAVLLGIMREAGIDHDVRLLIGLALWTVLAGLLVAGLAGVARLVPRPAEDDPPSLARWFGRNWYPMALMVLGFLWLATLLVAIGAGIRALRAGALSILLIGYAPALMHGVTTTLRSAMARRGGPSQAGNRIWATALVRCSRILVLIGIALILANIWDIDPIGIASDRLGEATVRAAVNVLFVVLCAYVVWEIVKALVRGNAASQERAEQEATEEIGYVQPASRIQTFLPLLEKFLLVVVIVVATLAAMKALGVDTGPLLAGAGIAGIAIGFGAQTLVRDIVSGIFFLFDDAFRLGEYVEIDQTRGTVEGISIRSLRIRHHRGAIHTVPFGTIQRLTNYSRDWIILKLEFLLAFDTDLRKVKKIVKTIGEEMLEDPEHGQHFLEPVKSQGVRRMEQIGMVVGVKFMAKPGEQFILRREVYQRVRDAFEENGIRFAQPQVVVQMPGGHAQELSPQQAEAVAAAASEAAIPEEPPAEKKAGGSKGR
jgi:moderate conductance mechanosensitive channel